MCGAPDCPKCHRENFTNGVYLGDIEEQQERDRHGNYVLESRFFVTERLPLQGDEPPQPNQQPKETTT